MIWLLEEYFYKNGRLFCKKSGKPMSQWTDKDGYLIHDRSFNGKRSHHRIHRLVFFMHNNFVPQQIDHINRKRDDNRIENLREATFSQNRRNSNPSTINKVGYRGVIKRAKSFRAVIKINKKCKWLGTYNSPEEAAHAYDIAAAAAFGSFAVLNFPERMR